MRVIAGEAKGRRLKGPPGHGTRPMTDRVREALFSSLGPEVSGARVLDLFAGSGSLGLEALSRGAQSAEFVEMDRAVVAVLRSNVDAVGLGGTVTRNDVTRYLAGPARLHDLVFVDPPYALPTQDLEDLLEAIVPWCAPGAVIVVHRRTGDPDPAHPTTLAVEDDRSYGGTHLIRYRREVE